MNIEKNQAHCQRCGKELTYDEIGIHKKMINRGAKEFFCLECLASYIGTTIGNLNRLIDKFREQGCILFK